MTAFAQYFATTNILHTAFQELSKYHQFFGFTHNFSASVRQCTVFH